VLYLQASRLYNTAHDELVSDFASTIYVNIIGKKILVHWRRSQIWEEY